MIVKFLNMSNSVILPQKIK